LTARHQRGAGELHGPPLLRGLAHRRPAGQDPKTVAKNKCVLEPLLAVIGSVRLPDLDVTDVDMALAGLAATRSSSTVAMAHLALTRAITRGAGQEPGAAECAALTGTPPSREGRPSRSMTLAQACDSRREGGRAADSCVRDAVTVHRGPD
jgi:hypothetical protein